MKIAIMGTRGIPNNYGGFEQFAEFLALGLVQKGHDVSVYNSHNHPYKKSSWNCVNIIHCFDPESKIGTIGQFVYDLNCIIDTRKRHYDIILQLGYTSSSIWWWLLPFNKSTIVTNMDGLEWSRSKYSSRVKKFLKIAEKWGAVHSDVLVADSIGIKDHLSSRYGINSTYIPYGANILNKSDSTDIVSFKLSPFNYDLLIARMEPENNIEIILDGFVRSSKTRAFVVIGNMSTSFGKYLTNKFEGANILFIGAIYDLKKLNNLRYFSNLYFHGHSVGGTNPSLLEAMGSSCLICAHNNLFNQSILGDDGYYFESAQDIALSLDSCKKEKGSIMIKNNLDKVRDTYNWKTIVDQYEKLFLDSI
ncbi:MAG: glycosyltransferase involved in cell wall biosynthesis [Parvicella sp.]|jgi:glycosyltransferase involved in cell wall biosynthesis